MTYSLCRIVWLNKTTNKHRLHAMGPLIHPICGLPLAMFSYGNTVSSIQICNMEVEKGENNTARKQWLLDFFNHTPYPLIDPCN